MELGELKRKKHMEDWYRITSVPADSRSARPWLPSKYSSSKVRKALPPDFAYVIEELITEKAEVYGQGGLLQRDCGYDHPASAARRSLSWL